MISRMRSLILLLTLGLALSPVLAAQKQQEILLTFSGLLKLVTNKQIMIEPEADNDMTFVRSKRTRFVRDGHQIKGSSIPKGSAVSIDAVQKLNGELEAVTVTVNDAAPQEQPKQ